VATSKGKKQQTYRHGVWAENMAALYMAGKGYRLLKKRYKTPVGEIDLIFKKKDMLVFAEVKARKDPAAALESLTPSMRGRITQAALYYLSEHNLADCACRFDLITVTPPFAIHHLDNAWEAGA
jgi:putative endonuclease